MGDGMDKFTVHWHPNSKEARMTDTTERINHPQHYGGDTLYEVIKIVEARRLDMSEGTALKYLVRAGKKDPAALVEDLKKARWYIERVRCRGALTKRKHGPQAYTDMLIIEGLGLEDVHPVEDAEGKLQGRRRANRRGRAVMNLLRREYAAALTWVDELIAHPTEDVRSEAFCLALDAAHANKA